MPPKKQKKEQEKAPTDESFQSVDISTREPRTVILMLSSPEPAVVVKALQALHQHMKKSEQNCGEMAELGVVSPLVGLLSSPAKATRSYSALCLSDMTTSAVVRRQVCAADDGLSSLMALLKPDEESVTVEHAAAIFSHMAREYSTKTQLLSLSAHRLLLPLITGADPNIQRYSLESVCQLVELHQARRAVAEEGGMGSLLSLLSSEFPVVQQLALKSLVSCSSDRECRTQLRDADGLSSLVSFLGNKDMSDLHLLAATVLSHCLLDAENMTSLQTSGSLLLLLSHITDTTANSDMKECATAALAKAAQDEVNRRILHEQNVEKTFIQLLSHSDGGVVIEALNGLSAMCGLVSGRARVGEEGGAGGVVSCAGREEGGVRAAAARCLAHISTDSPANCKLIHEAEGCPAVVRLLRDEQASCRSGAAATVTHMAPNPLTREELITAEVVPALVSCLEFAEVTVQRSAAEALAVLGTDSVARSQFGASGGVASCLPLLSSGNTSLLSSALSLLRSMGQSLELAQEFCGNGALELLTQLSKRSHAPSAVGPALQQLLNSDLCAKWWTHCHLQSSDIITNMEFFDPGPALAGAQAYSSLSSLLSHPPHMNRPILTANLLLPEVTPTSVETTPTPAVTEQMSPSHQRSKSRSKGRKGQEVESRVSNPLSREDQQTTDQSESSEGSGRGLLPMDRGLQSHISHVLSSLTSLPSLPDQALALASYVCNSMGGPVTNPGNMTFELPQSELQKGAGSNVVAIGNITMGTYRHRALLYKILCDQVGVACSLTRGDYGRHWNTVSIATETPRSYVVDLMTSGGQLLEEGSPQAHQYCHI